MQNFSFGLKFSHLTNITQKENKFVLEGKNSTNNVIISMLIWYALYALLIFVSRYLFPDISFLVGVVCFLPLFIVTILTINAGYNYRPTTYFEISKEGIFCSNKSDKSVTFALDKNHIQSMRFIQEYFKGNTKIFVFINDTALAFAYFELKGKINAEDWQLLLKPYWETWGLTTKKIQNNKEKAELSLVRQNNSQNTHLEYDTHNFDVQKNTQNTINNTFESKITENNTHLFIQNTSYDVYFLIPFGLGIVFFLPGVNLLITHQSFEGFIPLIFSFFAFGVSLYIYFYDELPKNIEIDKSTKNMILTHRTKSVIIKYKNIKKILLKGDFTINKSQTTFWVYVYLVFNDDVEYKITNLYDNHYHTDKTQQRLYLYGQSMAFIEKINNILKLEIQWEDNWEKS